MPLSTSNTPLATPSRFAVGAATGISLATGRPAQVMTTSLSSRRSSLVASWDNEAFAFATPTVSISHAS